MDNNLCKNWCTCRHTLFFLISLRGWIQSEIEVLNLKRVAADKNEKRWKFSSSFPLLQTLKNGARTTASQITAHFTSKSLCITRMSGKKQESNKKPINRSVSIQTKRVFLSPPPTDASRILDLTFNVCLPEGWTATTPCANSTRPSMRTASFSINYEMARRRQSA